MKIGIITQPLYANYGGILQNYALQQVLKKMGHSPITLDYMPSLSFGRYILYVGKNLLFSLSPVKRRPIKPYKHFLERPTSIDSFVRHHIDLTKTISRYSKRLLRKNKIDALIVGSDQVWRYSYNSHYIKDMYLWFANDYPCRKITYAASFGVERWDYPDSVSQEIRKQAKVFDSVSVRERSGVEICCNHLGVDASLVLDPTLLLNVSDYDRFCTAPVPAEEPFLVAYLLDMNKEKAGLIENVANKKGLLVKYLTVSASSCSIEEWLSTIRRAAFVITDSYHGSLFSILFEKQFLTIINKKRGADRFNTLFENLGLQDRLLDSATLLPDSEKRIDYSVGKQKLEQFRNMSLSYLATALS